MPGSHIIRWVFSDNHDLRWVFSDASPFVLVSQNEPIVEVFFKQDENTWQYSVAKGLESTVTLKSVEYEIALKDIYKKILFEK